MYLLPGEKPKKKAPAETKAIEKKENLLAAVLKAEIDALERKLKDLYRQRNQFLFTINMKEIRQAEGKKVKGDLARVRQTQYRLLKPEKSTDDGIGSSRIIITNEEYTEFQQDALPFLKRSDGRLTIDGGHTHWCCLRSIHLEMFKL
ncbi:hypothetical protein K501DRAFT_266351 [Backusella circina FSU 941]|nr:hypothetical protein K501DRAFT_266351 [Backusella circina FSU 941]